MSQAPGWYRDPFFRGQERYWDGRVWTQGTRPVEAAVTPVTEDAGVAAAAAEEPAASDPVDAAMSRLAAALEPDAAPAPATPAPAAAPPPPSFAPLGAPVRPAAAVAPGAPPGGWPPPTVGTVGPPPAGRKGSRRTALYAIAAAALLFVAGGVSAALLLGGSGNASAQEAVANAAAQTINAHSADMTMSIGVSVMSVHESVTASGALDFANKMGTMSVTIPVGGKQYTEQEILDGSTIYVNVGALSTGLAPTKPWVSENVGQSGSSSNGLGALDPTAMLQQLQSVGGTVTSLGQTTYDGTSVTEYAATLPSSAMMGAVGKLPASLQQGVSGLNLPDMHMNIYVTQDNLLKALEVPSYSVSYSGQTLSMNMTLVLSNYGTPVTVTPPPADQVEPFSQFGSGLGNTGSTGNTGSVF